MVAGLAQFLTPVAGRRFAIREAYDITSGLGRTCHFAPMATLLLEPRKVSSLGGSPLVICVRKRRRRRGLSHKSNGHSQNVVHRLEVHNKQPSNRRQCGIYDGGPGGFKNSEHLALTAKDGSGNQQRKVGFFNSNRTI